MNACLTEDRLQGVSEAVCVACEGAQCTEQALSRKGFPFASLWDVKLRVSK